MNYPLAKRNKVDIIAHPMPLRASSPYEDTIPSGFTVEEILNGLGVGDINDFMGSVWLDGNFIEHKYWSDVRPKANTELEIQAMPQGGDDGAKIAQAAILVGGTILSGGAFGALSTAAGSGLLGLGSAAGQAAAAFTLVGQLAVSSLVEPPNQNRTRNNTGRDSIQPTITGTRNQVNKYGPIPLVLGEHQVFPPKGAEPFTEIVGDTQYVREIFVVGYGPLDIKKDTLKIGETDIDEFDDVELEIREGTDSDDPRELYTSSVSQQTFQVDIDEEDGWVTRTSEAEADELSFDLTFSSGLIQINDDGSREKERVKLAAEYSVSGQNNWKKVPAVQNTIPEPRESFNSDTGTYGVRNNQESDKLTPAPDGNTTTFNFDNSALEGGSESIKFLDTDSGLTEQDPSTYSVDLANGTVTFDTAPSSNIEEIWAGYNYAGEFVVENKNARRFARGFTFTPDDTPNQYDIRIKRITEDRDDNNNIRDQVTWTELATIEHEDPIQTDKNVATIAIRIKATDQLSGTLEKLNVVAQTRGKDYNSNTDTWETDQTLSNPASIYREVLQSPASPRQADDSEIDLETLEEWHTYCEDKGFEYNSVIDTKDTVFELLKEIASVARASFNQLDGQYTVAIDKERTSPVQNFTPRNSFDFSGNKTFRELPDALRMQFVNSKGDLYEEDEVIVYDDGFGPNNATNFEKMDLPGVTNPQQAQKLGRYHIGVGKLRPETFTIKTDVENVICTKGDLITVTHDAPLIGESTGRVAGQITDGNGNVEGVELDEIAPMDSGTNYSIRFRIQDGMDVVNLSKPVVTNPGEPKQVIFDNEIPSGDLAPTFDDLFMFGETDKVTSEFKVREVKGRDDLQAEIVMVNEDREIYDFSEEIGSFDTNLTLPGQLEKPSIQSVQSGNAVAVLQNDGKYDNRIVVTLDKIDGLQFIDRIEAQFRLTGQEEWNSLPDLNLNQFQFDIDAVEAGNTYEIRVRTVAELGQTSEWVYATETIEGQEGPPPDVENFDVDIMGDTAKLTWDKIEVRDVTNYEIRFIDDITATPDSWANAVTIVDSVARDTNTISTNAKVGTYLIKAYDLANNESQNAATVSSNIARLETLNAIETIEEDPDFTGTRSNVILTEDNELTLQSDNVIGDWDRLSNISNLAYGTNGIVSSGEYFFSNSIDLGTVYNCKVSKSLTVTGQNVNNIVADWENVADINNVAGGNPNDHNVIVRERHTEDDPNSANPDWSEWAGLQRGDIQARAFEFKAILRSSQSNIRPIVSELSASVDMPDVVKGAKDVQSTTSGVDIVFNEPYREIDAVGVTVNNEQTGDYWNVTSKSATGFHVDVFDADDNKVDRSFDWTSVGFGKEIN